MIVSRRESTLTNDPDRTEHESLTARTLVGPDVLFLATVAGGALLELPSARFDSISSGQQALLVILGVGLAASAVGQTLSRTRLSYVLLVALHATCCVALVGPLRSTPFQGLLVFLPLTIGACIHLSFPNSLLQLVPVHLAVVGTRLIHETEVGALDSRVLVACAGYVLVNAAVAALATSLVEHREREIRSLREADRLRDLVDKLTKTNIGYQEYAITVKERSGELERRKITRDIHDLVGYTLTNTITLLEAVEETMETNPLGVARLVKLARQNGTQGLADVRSALRTLRSTETVYPSGKRAIRRLIQSFRSATGVQVELAYTQTAADFEPAVEAALFHVVQESMVNALRHGAATRIWVFLREDNESIELSVLDNGSADETFEEGIGISGMRERLEELGGRLWAGGRQGGWAVRAFLPKRSRPGGPRREDS